MSANRRHGVAALAALTLAAACAAPDPLLVQTEVGLLGGTYADEEAGIRVFKGVPFAAPPVGPDRWRPPSPAASWDGVRRADEIGSPCWQRTGRAESVYSKGVTDPSEDCLYLNVWTAPQQGGPSPVMVWFHGGGNTAGHGGSLIFDGTELARKGATIVTVNYRLGAFGFLAHPALTAESESGSSGNYGLLDQIAALEWVQANIEAFGGDPDRVTIFGQSAGSSDSCRLMVSPLASGLFHRVIGQSGSCLGDDVQLDASPGAEGDPSAHQSGLRFAAAFGVEGEGPDAAERLRAIDAERLQTTRTEGGTGPIVDGWVIPGEPRALFEKGDFHNVPLMVGSMGDEGTGAPAGARNWARLVESSDGDVYLYYFSHPTPAFRLYIPEDPHLDVEGGVRGMGAYHSGDLAYVFNNTRLLGVGWEEHDHRLADVISSYWVSFAATGDPNAEGLPEWPAYEKAADELIEFGSTVTAVPNPRGAELDLIDAGAGG